MVFPLPSRQLRVAPQTPKGVLQQSKVWLSLMDLMEEPISNPTGNIFFRQKRSRFNNSFVREGGSEYAEREFGISRPVAVMRCCVQAPVVPKLDKIIQQMPQKVLVELVQWIVIFPLDSRQHYPEFDTDRQIARQQYPEFEQVQSDLLPSLNDELVNSVPLMISETPTGQVYLLTSLSV